jgi:type IV pilus assembly protein PilE
MPHPVNKKDSGCRACCAGFSLAEIMLALAIVALLAALAYPAYSAAVRKARRAEGRTALMQLMQQQERYYSRNNSYVAFSSSDPQGFKWYSGNTAPGRAYEISASACGSDGLQSCVLLSARPGTANVNAAYTDDGCGTLTLASTGAQGADGSLANCW